MTPYERVRQSRELTAATFPLPSVLDCVRYAITELAEYDDALLRQERTGDKRNNDKQHDPRNELGQALYMLLSAAVQLGKEPRQYVGAGEGTRMEYAAALYSLSKAVSYSFRLARIGANDPQAVFDRAAAIDGAYRAMRFVSQAHGWDVDALIDDTCAAFERKHAPAREVR